jgi:hypothetical protein
MAKLKTVRITAVMETDLEYVCNIPEDMSLEDFKDYCKYRGDIGGGMWEQGGDCMFSGGWNWGDVNILEFDKNAINETDDILKEKNDE